MSHAAPLPSDYAHRRRDARLRIRRGIPASLISLDGQMSASLTDLSQSGAHLRTRTPLRRGQDLIVWWLGFEAFGKVVWVNGLEAGVEFHEMLPAVALLHTRDQVDHGVAKSSAEEAYDQARAWYQGYR